MIEITAKEAIKMIEADGWYFFESIGGHYQYKHPIKKGKVTIAYHKGDIHKGTLNSIMKQAGLKRK